MSAGCQVLLLGFGNPGRADDGLGPALAGAVAALALPLVHAESSYHLKVEDSLEALLADIVVFVDASVLQDAPFHFVPVRPDGSANFSSHAISPADLMGVVAGLCAEMPDAYLLTIRGSDFNRLHEGLSGAAQRDLAAALRFLVPLLEACDPAAFRAACALSWHE